MLYASTRDTLKRQLGYNSFTDEMHGSSPVRIKISRCLFPSFFVC